MKILRFNALCTTLATLVLHSCTTAPAYALMPIRWVADGAKPTAYATQIAQGETRDLVCTLKNYGAPVAVSDSATATLFYQTNGMGSLYWAVPATVTTNGIITATWSPALDAGAAVYSFALGVEEGTNRTYTAYGVLRMRLSPGFVPNTLPLPRQSLDFATLDILNAPWLPAEWIDSSQKWRVPRDGIMLGFSEINEYTILGAGFMQMQSGLSTLSIAPGLGSSDSGRWFWPDTDSDSPLIKRDELEEATASLATTNWVEAIRGIHADIATNVVYHVVVSNGHWLIKEVQ